MSQGPNFVALNDIKGSNVIPLYQQPSTNNNMQELEKIIENNRKFQEVMKNLKNQFDYLGDTNTHITEFYPKFITDNHYLEDMEKEIIYDQSMADLLFKLERENRDLKVEVKAWMQQFGKKASLTQLLVKANRTLQEQIVSQDKDLVRIIDALGNKETEELKELEERMNELKVENGLAIQHLYEIQDEIGMKKGCLVEMGQSMEDHQARLSETRQRLAESAEEEDHQTKMYAMMKTITDNLTLDIAQLDNQNHHLSNENISLNSDKEDLSRFLNNNKGEIGNMRTVVINENDQKMSKEKHLRREVSALDEKMKFLNEKGKKLEGDFAREERMVEHYVKASSEVELKVKNSTQHFKSIEANLTKQLEKEADKGSSILTLKYEIELLEKDIELVQNNRKQQEAEYPGKLKMINEKCEAEREKLERQLQDLDSERTRSLRNLNSEVFMQKAELDRAQRNLVERNEDLKDARNERIEIKGYKAEIRELGIKLREMIAQSSRVQ